ncbi:pex21p [Saccharomyces arboricola H-6]|uniref:Pex21p n=1 Tax=Saccharomyces arboricola (strain H-6 / AS 2.3317 / CBS 10644) TaxID=1160507 RepID=J8PNC9_SACAR|nr:pex21p [Saccharomyces arboricola H-6]
MSSACHISPIEQIIQKGHRIQKDSLIPSKPTKLVHRELKTHYIEKGSHVETSFLHHAGGMGSVDNTALQHQHSPMTFSRQNKNEESSNWIPQFSSMTVNDPLEFSSEYKKLYSNYESQPYQSSSSQHFPMVRKTISNFSQRNILRPHRQGNRSSPMEAFQFDTEFQHLENEIQEVRYEPLTQEDEKWLDQHQLELQRIATDIVKCCTPPPSSTSSTSTASSVDSKLSESKFIQLMRGISSGDVTLKKEANGDSASELFSLSNGELVGNKHISIRDQSHEDVYN